MPAAKINSFTKNKGGPFLQHLISVLDSPFILALVLLPGPQSILVSLRQLQHSLTLEKKNVTSSRNVQYLFILPPHLGHPNLVLEGKMTSEKFHLPREDHGTHFSPMRLGQSGKLLLSPQEGQELLGVKLLLLPFPFLCCDGGIRLRLAKSLEVCHRLTTKSRGTTPSGWCREAGGSIGP